MTVKDQIMKRANELNANYLFLGYHGRKGLKEDVTIMGSTMKKMSYNMKIPTFIVILCCLINKL